MLLSDSSNICVNHLLEYQSSGLDTVFSSVCLKPSALYLINSGVNYI